MHKILSITLSLVLTASLLYAQKTAEKPFILGTVEQIKSTQLGETRTLNIYLPEAYHPDSAARYPVIYLLDGSANEDFIHIVGLVQFLNMIQVLPPSIVVGIANVDRKRDFTFPTTITNDKTAYPTTGGSEKFIAFLEKDLKPFIEKKYKTAAPATIIGQSLGGLLATEVLLKKPALFDQYIIVSPSLWWDSESLLTLAPKLLQQQQDQAIRVYVSVGEEGKQMKGVAKKLVQTLKKSGKKQVKTDYVFMPEENHKTILHNSVYKAFEILNKK